MAWDWLARLPRRWRCPVKALLFLAVLVLVLFPHPVYLARQVAHLADTEALIQPELPFIAGINREIDALLPAQPTQAQELKAVERYVYTAIPYAFDWEVWANLDYWPTAAEVWARRREDCDGRAVLTASILRARGFKDARLVGNLNHVWVAAAGKELLGAEKDKNFRRENGRLVITPPKTETLRKGLAQVKHFPAWRLAVLMLAALLLALHPARSARGFIAAALPALLSLAILYRWAEASATGKEHGLLLALSAALFVVSLALAFLMEHLLVPPERRAPTPGADAVVQP